MPKDGKEAKGYCQGATSKNRSVMYRVNYPHRPVESFI